MKKTKNKKEQKVMNVSEDTLEFLSLDDETIEEYVQKSKSARSKKKKPLHKPVRNQKRRDVYEDEWEEDEEDYETEELEDIEDDEDDEEYYEIEEDDEEDDEDEEYYEIDEDDEDEEYYEMEEDDEDEDDEEYYEIDEDDEDDDEYYEIDDEDDEYEDDDEEDGFFARIGYFIGNMSSLDHVVLVFGCFILMAAVATGIIYVGAKMTSKQVEAFAEIGSEMEQIGVIGESGLLAVSNAESTRLSQMMNTPEAIQEQEEQNASVEVAMNLTSIQSDIKIKFVNKRTNKLINGIPFEVEVTGDNGKTYSLKDEDKDGIIYQTGVNAGTYTIKALALSGEEYEKYVMPSPGTLKVTDTIAYKKVDVADEIKTEAEVNVAIEDTAKQDTVVESVLTDTVEWVESTRTEIDSDNNYQEIKKSDIPDPSTLGKSASFVKLAAMNPVSPHTEGEGSEIPSDPELTDEDKLSKLSPSLSDSSITLDKGGSQKLSVSTSSDASYSYSVTWSSSDASVASVDSSGNVTAQGAGSATVTASVTVGSASKELSCSVTVKDSGSTEPDKPTEPTEPTDQEKLDKLSPGLNKTSLSLSKDGKEALSVSTSSDASYSYSVTWSSSNASVASVDSNGNVTAAGAGSATITATVKVGNATKDLSCSVTVELANSDKLSKLKPVINKTSLSLSKNAKETLSIATASDAPYSYTVTWSSDNANVASVSNSGEVTAVGNGTANITATVSVGSDSTRLTCTVTVTTTDKTKLEELKPTLNTTSLTLSKGGSAALAISVTGKEEYKVEWSSSDKSIASVDEKGVVKGEKIGDAKITARVKIGEAYQDLVCSVKVSDVKYTALKIEGVSALYVGKTGTVKGTTTPSGGTVSWTSDNEKVVKIDSDGKMTGVSVGTATITGTCGDAKNTWKVTVTKDVSGDTTSKLKDKNGNQIFVKNSDGKYIEATYADYYKDQKLYLRRGEAAYSYTGWQTIDGSVYFFDKNGNYITGDQVIQGAKYSFGSDGRLSSGSGSLGIDVSKWNGTIDWNAVKNSGISYVIIRCGYRGSSTGALIEDPRFKSNIQGAKNAGLKVGVYFFSQAVNEVEAVEEASMAINLVNGYGLNYPIFLDVESSGGRGDKIDAGTRTAVCKAFCNTIQNSGYSAGIYANKTWLTSYMNTASLTGYKIWLAQYASTPSYSATRYDMWQYSSKGKVTGINGNVDMNISYLSY